MIGTNCCAHRGYLCTREAPIAAAATSAQHRLGDRSLRSIKPEPPRRRPANGFDAGGKSHPQQFPLRRRRRAVAAFAPLVRALVRCGTRGRVGSKRTRVCALPSCPQPAVDCNEPLEPGWPHYGDPSVGLLAQPSCATRRMWLHLDSRARHYETGGAREDISPRMPASSSRHAQLHRRTVHRKGRPLASHCGNRVRTRASDRVGAQSHAKWRLT